jgi:hypothetical protein
MPESLDIRATMFLRVEDKRKEAKGPDIRTLSYNRCFQWDLDTGRFHQSMEDSRLHIEVDHKVELFIRRV